MKARCIEVLQELVAEHQERRAKATDDVVEEFWKIRKLKYDYPEAPKAEMPSGKKQKQRGGAKNQKWNWCLYVMYYIYTVEYVILGVLGSK